MKLSLSWIFDHLLGSWHDYDINDILKQCNVKVAEIDQCIKLNIDLSNFTLVRVSTITPESIGAFSLEWNKELSLPVRTDAQVGNYYVIKKTDKGPVWAQLTDWASSKDGLIPAVHVDDLAVAGSWKDAFENEDYILEVDNVTITNRPDLWCHRGFAREFGALLNIPLKPLDMLLTKATLEKHDTFASSTPNNPFGLEIKDTTLCKRFAGMYLSSVVCRPSPLLMAQRLAKVDARPINSLVDITNYVTFDISQPLHAFDAQKLHGNKLIQRLAHKGEKVTLLDGQTIELTQDDLVVADAKKPVGLAGIMGGAETGVTAETSAVLLESANYHASAIRKSSTRFKLRTEASARFEKSLDPNQNVTGILRFIKLLEDEKVPFESNFTVQSLGHEVEPQHIKLSHAYIESMLGVQVSQEYIIKTLEHLEFGVEQQEHEYVVTVPTFRGTKDVTIKEDIVEEIARFYGYDKIPAELPALPLNISDISRVTKMRAIKQQLAFGMHAHEVQNYPCYDEEFLHKIKWQPDEYVAIKNPVSEHSRRMVTSLIPHLCKNITQNPKEAAVRFFEINNTWQKNKKAVTERLALAGIVYDKHNAVSFYDGKDYLETLFGLLKLECSWQKTNDVLPVWFHPYQTAVIKYQDVILGYAGTINPSFFSAIAEGDAFIFELDADTLLSLEQEKTVYTPLAKYPETSLDVSMLVPLTVTVQMIKDRIKQAHAKIISVELIDIFQKDSWENQKSVTVRFVARDPEKTLEKQDIDALHQNVLASLKDLGAEIR